MEGIEGGQAGSARLLIGGLPKRFIEGNPEYRIREESLVELDFRCPPVVGCLRHHLYPHIIAVHELPPFVCEDGQCALTQFARSAGRGDQHARINVGSRHSSPYPRRISRNSASSTSSFSIGMPAAAISARDLAISSAMLSPVRLLWTSRSTSSRRYSSGERPRCGQRREILRQFAGEIECHTCI